MTEIDDRTQAIDPAQLKNAVKEARSTAAAERNARFTGKRAELVIRGLLGVSALCALGAGLLFYIGKGELSEGAARLGFLAKNWNSPLPLIEEVRREEYARLRATAETPVGTPAALAIVKELPTGPVLYIASNLGDSPLEVRLDGIGRTLVGRRSAELRLGVPMRRGFGKTELQRPGESLTLGKYKIRLLAGEAALSDGDVVFLGGKEDAEYARKLGEYHEQLRQAYLAQHDQLAGIATELLTGLELLLKDVARLKGSMRYRDKVRLLDSVRGAWIALEGTLAGKFSAMESASGERFYSGDTLTAFKSGMSKVRQISEALSRQQRPELLASENALLKIKTEWETLLKGIKEKIQTPESFFQGGPDETNSTASVACASDPAV